MYLARFNTGATSFVQGAIELPAIPANQTAWRDEFSAALEPLTQELEQRRDMVSVVLQGMGGAVRSTLLLVASRDELSLRSLLLRWHQVGEAFGGACVLLMERREFDEKTAPATGVGFELHNRPEIRDGVKFYPCYRLFERWAGLTAQIRAAGEIATACWRLAALDSQPHEKHIRVNQVRMQRDWIPARVRGEQEALASNFLEHPLIADQFIVCSDAAAPVVRRILHEQTSAYTRRSGFSSPGYSEQPQLDASALAVEWLASEVEQYEPVLGNAARRGILRQLVMQPSYSTYARLSPERAPSPTPRSVFISYSHRDQELAKQFSISCAQLRRDGWIRMWSDAEILPGAHWHDDISDALESAQIIVLLISPDFIQSDFCYAVEMHRALQRHEQGEARVLPVLVRSTDVTNAPFERLQMLPSGRKPITSWADRDAAWLDVVTGLRRALQFSKLPSATQCQESS